MTRHPPTSPLFPYTPLFRPPRRASTATGSVSPRRAATPSSRRSRKNSRRGPFAQGARGTGNPILRSEEHTSELQSLTNLVCRLLLEKNKRLHLTHSTFRMPV